MGVNVPQEFVDNAMKASGDNPAAPVAPAAEEIVLPPPFANDSALSNYPAGELNKRSCEYCTGNTALTEGVV